MTLRYVSNIIILRFPFFLCIDNDWFTFRWGKIFREPVQPKTERSNVTFSTTVMTNPSFGLGFRSRLSRPMLLGMLWHLSGYNRIICLFSRNKGSCRNGFFLVRIGIFNSNPLWFSRNLPLNKYVQP